MEIQFQWLQHRTPFDAADKRLEPLQRLNSSPGVSIPRDGSTRRPPIQLAALTTEGGIEQMLETLSWTVAEIRAS